MQHVTELAAAQHGAVSIAQLRECGLLRRAQRTALAEGRLEMAGPTVAVVGGSPDTWRRRLQVGLLALGPDAWVSHEAAAALLGLDRALDEPLDFTVPRGHGRASPVGRVHTTAHIGGLDVVTVDGFRCSSATRTILDLAYLRIGPFRLAAAIDSAMRTRRSAFSVLEQRLAELRGSGRYGVRLLDRLLPDTGGESPLERQFLGLLRRHGLPRPALQYRLVRPNGIVARVDFRYVGLPLVIEVTGRKGHASDAERQRDAQRRNELTDLGFRVYEYTRGDIEDRPAWVASTVRERYETARRRHTSFASTEATGTGRLA